MANFGSLNPNFDWGSFLGNALTDLSAGLATQNTVGKALGAAAVQNADLQPARATAALQKQQREEQKTKDNQTRQFLSLHAPELVPVYDADPNAAMNAYIAKIKPPAPADPFTLGPGEVRYGPNGQEIARGPDKPESQADLPASYREFLLAQQNPEYAKTLASSSSKPPTDQDVRMKKLSEVVQPDIDLLTKPTGADGKTVYDSLSDMGNQFWNGVDINGAKPLAGATSPEFQQAQAALGNIAQSYLYAISGQAAPASEVKKIVDSVTPFPLESAASIAEKKRRLESYVEAIKMTKYDAAGMMKGGEGDGNNDPLGIR